MCWEGVNYNQVLRSIDAAQPSLNRNVTGLNVGTRLKALGATDYVRIRWYGRAKQQRLAYGARLSHRGTVVSTSLRGTRSPQTSRRVAKRTAGTGDIIEVIMISCLCLNRLDSSNE